MFQGTHHVLVERLSLRGPVVGGRSGQLQSRRLRSGMRAAGRGRPAETVAVLQQRRLDRSVAELVNAAATDRDDWLRKTAKESRVKMGVLRSLWNAVTGTPSYGKHRTRTCWPRRPVRVVRTGRTEPEVNGTVWHGPFPSRPVPEPCVPIGIRRVRRRYGRKSFSTTHHHVFRSLPLFVYTPSPRVSVKHPSPPNRFGQSSIKRWILRKSSTKLMKKKINSYTDRF